MATKSQKSKTYQEKLRAFLSRRHPEYEDKLPHWKFMWSCYEGGRSWFDKNIFRYIKEGNKEYSERVERAYRFNHTREVVDLVNKYLFKMEITRNADDAPTYIKKFWENATLNDLSIDDFMREVSKMSSIYGRLWIVVDNDLIEKPKTKAEEQLGRVYAYLVTPDNVVDMSYDEHGRLNWILIHEETRDDEDPLEATGEIVHRFRLWEREQYTIYTLNRNKKVSLNISASQLVKAVEAVANKSVERVATYVTSQEKMENFDIEVKGPFAHEFGMVPVFSADNEISSELYTSTALIDDIAYLDRAISNYLSNLDAIIQDQTFSQLIMPAQGLLPGEEGHEKIVKMGTSRIFTYDGEHGSKPEYISPDVRQAEIILKVINKIINEIYHTVGLAGERTKEDNALGIDNSSGVAKAYDFERVNSLLISKADSLESIENRLAYFVARWNGEEKSFADFVKLSNYPKNFDVRGLYDEFEIAANLKTISAPDSVRRKQMETVIDKLFPNLGRELKEAFLVELKKWPPIKDVEPKGNTENPLESDT